METIIITISPFAQGVMWGIACTSAVWIGVIIGLVQISKKYQKKKTTFAENARMN